MYEIREPHARNCCVYLKYFVAFGMALVPIVVVPLERVEGVFRITAASDTARSGVESNKVILET